MLCLFYTQTHTEVITVQQVKRHKPLGGIFTESVIVV